MGSCSLKNNSENKQAIVPLLVSDLNQVKIEASESEPQKPEESIERRHRDCKFSNSKRLAVLEEDRKKSLVPSDAPSAQVKDIPKTQKDLDLIEHSFSQNFIFSTLTHEQKIIVINSMKNYSLGSNQIVFKQGQPGNNYFIISSGMVEILSNDVRVSVLSEGVGFGEIALMHDTPRTATVRTLTPVILWGLDRLSFKSIIEDLNAINYNENKAFLESVSIFSVLKPSQIEALVGSIRSLNYSPGQIIVKEGDSGDIMYIIKEGVVSCTRNKVEIKKFVKGEYFGEQALIHNSTRTATCVALTRAKCLSIDRESLNVVLGTQLQSVIFKNSQFIIFQRNEILNKLSSVQIEIAIKAMKIRKYQGGEMVLPANTLKSEFLIMVLKGKIQISDRVVEKFECLGSEELVESTDEVYEHDIFSIEQTDIAMISKVDFEKSIGGNFNFITTNNSAFKILRNVAILRGLSDEKLQLLIVALKTESYRDKQLIVEQDSEGGSFYIVKSGRVDVTMDGHNIRTITKHDYFGERSIILNTKRTATVVANGEVECWVLFQADFLKIINEHLRNQLLKRIELQDDNLALEDLQIIKTLGKGMFGNVFLASNKKTKVMYALKTVARKKIDSYSLHKNLILERKVLLQIDHIFIMKLIKTFKDSKRIYFVTEYVRGMDLFDVIRDMPHVSEADSRFYTACLMVILEHLHDRDIIYRDLKPENVVVDEEGYLKLIDFGTAKIVIGRTYTIVGTPHYMAPEIILRKGYGVSADYWSLGVVLYELLFERVPFADNLEEPMKIYEAILVSKLVYPQIKQTFADVKSLIDLLLNKNPSKRMGGGFEKLKLHPWFSIFDWEQLLLKRVKSPYLPKVENIKNQDLANEDSSVHFDGLIENEEIGELPSPFEKIPKGWDEDF